MESSDEDNFLFNANETAMSYINNKKNNYHTDNIDMDLNAQLRSMRGSNVVPNGRGSNRPAALSRLNDNTDATPAMSTTRNTFATSNLSAANASYSPVAFRTLSSESSETSSPAVLSPAPRNPNPNLKQPQQFESSLTRSRSSQFRQTNNNSNTASLSSSKRQEMSFSNGGNQEMDARNLFQQMQQIVRELQAFLSECDAAAHARGSISDAEYWAYLSLKRICVQFNDMCTNFNFDSFSVAMHNLNQVRESSRSVSWTFMETSPPVLRLSLLAARLQKLASAVADQPAKSGTAIEPQQQQQQQQQLRSNAARFHRAQELRVDEEQALALSESSGTGSPMVGSFHSSLNSRSNSLRRGAKSSAQNAGGTAAGGRAFSRNISSVGLSASDSDGEAPDWRQGKDAKSKESALAAEHRTRLERSASAHSSSSSDDFERASNESKSSRRKYHGFDDHASQNFVAGDRRSKEKEKRRQRATRDEKDSSRSKRSGKNLSSRVRDVGSAAREALLRRHPKRGKQMGRRTSSCDISPLASPPTSPYTSMSGQQSALRIKKGSNGMFVVITEEDRMRKLSKSASMDDISKSTTPTLSPNKRMAVGDDDALDDSLDRGFQKSRSQLSISEEIALVKELDEVFDLTEKAEAADDSFGEDEMLDDEEDTEEELTKKEDSITQAVDESSIPDSKKYLCRVCEQVFGPKSMEFHVERCLTVAKSCQVLLSRSTALTKLTKIVQERSSSMQGNGLPRSQEEKYMLKQMAEICDLPNSNCVLVSGEQHGSQVDLQLPFLGLPTEQLLNTKEMLRTIGLKCKSEKSSSLSSIFKLISSTWKKLLSAAEDFITGEDQTVSSFVTIADESRAAFIQKVVKRWWRTVCAVHPKCVPKLSDFEFLKPISKGGFSRVYLARKKQSDDLFAIKVLYKEDMVLKNLVRRVEAERDILAGMNHESVVRFFWSFHSKNRLYFVLQFVPGGDMYSLLCNLGFLDEKLARQFAAEAVLCLEYIHSKSIIHRDLKPDNILIQLNGRICVTDFGLSKIASDDSAAVEGNSKRPMVLNDLKHHLGDDIEALKEAGELGSVYLANRDAENAELVGTPDYLAPELLLGAGHSCTADWWSLGIILFEFLMGLPPFHASDSETIFFNILNGKVEWPSCPGEISKEALDLIQRLLDPNPKTRLGSEGAEQVKKHQFFADVDWSTVMEQSAVFRPSTIGEEDTSYFNPRDPVNDLSSDEEYDGQMFTTRSKSGAADNGGDVKTGADKNGDRADSVVVLRSSVLQKHQQQLSEGASHKVKNASMLARVSERDSVAHSQATSETMSDGSSSVVRLGTFQDIENAIASSPRVSRVDVMSVFEQFPYSNLKGLEELTREKLTLYKESINE